MRDGKRYKSNHGPPSRGDADPHNGRSGLDNVASQIAIARAAFDALGGTLEHDVFSGGHRWDGARAIPWMGERLADAG